MAFDAADLADGQRDIDARHIGARTRESADHAGAGVWRAADDLHRLAVAGVDGQDLQAIGFRMLFGRQDLGDNEGLVGRLVVDVLDLEADGRQSLADFLERGVGFQVILQPGECEFHCLVPIRILPEASSGRAPDACLPRSILTTVTSRSMSGQWMLDGMNSTLFRSTGIAS